MASCQLFGWRRQVVQLVWNARGLCSLQSLPGTLSHERGSVLMVSAVSSVCERIVASEHLQLNLSR